MRPPFPLRLLAYLAPLLVAASTVLVPTIGASTTTFVSNERAITQHSVDGARLGLTRQEYVKVFGPPRVDRLEGGLTVLVYARAGAAVFMRSGTGIAINVWGRTFRTTAGVGPCSPARALTEAYGSRLRRLPTSGPVSLYRVGNLVFRVFDGRVGAVTLGRGTLARLIAGNSIDCGSR